MKQKIIVFSFIFVLFLTLFSTLSVAEEDDDDIEIFGLELEKLLYLGSGLIATALFIITLFAYNRTKRSRIKFVSFAFLLFAIKGFLLSSELFIDEISWLDPTASVLNFLILFILFYGLVKH